MSEETNIKDDLNFFEQHRLEQLWTLGPAAEEALEALKKDPEDTEAQRKACVAVKNVVVEIQDFMDDLTAIRNAFEGELATTLPWRTYEFEDWGRVEVRSDSRRTWDHDRVLAVVLSRARDQAVDADTGEMRDPLLVAEDLLKKVCAFGYWRMGNLKSDLGIDGAAYSDVTYGRKRVKFS